MSKQLEDDFKICIDRVIESRYEDDKINCCIMDLKSKVLREMATLSNNKYTAPQATPKSCWNCFFFNSCYEPDEPAENIKLCSKHTPA